MQALVAEKRRQADESERQLDEQALKIKEKTLDYLQILFNDKLKPVQETAERVKTTLSAEGTELNDVKEARKQLDSLPVMF